MASRSRDGQASPCGPCAFKRPTRNTMSRSGRAGWRRPIAEDIPNELLFYIFEAATAVPDPLHHCHLDFRGNRRMDPFARERYDESLVSYLYIS